MTTLSGGSTHAGPAVQDAVAVAAGFHVDVTVGLPSDEAARRLAADGPNELVPAAEQPWWVKALDQFRDPLVYLLGAAVLVSLVAWVVDGRVGVPVDALVIAVIVLANAALGFVQEARAEHAVAALQSMTAVTSVVLRDGRLVDLPSADLVRGDVLVLAEGDSVGADARLVAVSSLHVAEASLIAVATLLTIDIFLPGGLVEGSDSLVVARTGGFTTLVLAQLFNAFNSRSETASVFHRLFVNPWLWAAVAVGAVAQVAVVELPFLQTAFGTAALDARQWVVCTAMASTVLVADELRKLIARRPASRLSGEPGGRRPIPGE